MQLCLIGYGKMGRAIEQIALERGHKITLVIDTHNPADLSNENLQNCNAAIEFTMPQSAVHHIKTCIDAGIPVVSGTTGWLSEKKNVEEYCRQKNGTFLYASNFSIGVNLFFEAAKDLSKIMKNQEGYGVSIRETHHTQKLDAPSGTAITLSEEVSSVLEQFDGFSLNEEAVDAKMPIYALREEDVPGTHELVFRNEIDEISLKHIAFNRNGFALGAVVAAEYIFDKKGVFTIREILKLIG